MSLERTSENGMDTDYGDEMMCMDKIVMSEGDAVHVIGSMAHQCGIFGYCIAVTITRSTASN